MEKEMREAWRQVIFDATGDASKADRAIELAELNGLLDPFKINFGDDYCGECLGPRLRRPRHGESGF